MNQQPSAIPDFDEILRYLRERVPRTAGPDRSLTFDERLAVVDDMLAALDTLPAGGQQYAMEKIAAFLQDQTGKLSGPLHERRMMLVERADALRLQAGRSVPDVTAFRPAASEILALLGRSA